MIPTRNIYGSLIPDELNEDELKLADSKSKHAFCTFAITQHILLQTSSAKKITFFEELFLDVKDHTYMYMTIQLMSKYFMGKRIAYLYTLDYTDYDLDITAKDYDRSLDVVELEICLKETIKWFKYLDNLDLKLGIFISFLSICGNNVIRQVILKIKQYYKKQPLIKSSRILSIINDMTAPSRTSVDDYVEDYDVNDPDVQLIYKKRNEWKDEMTKYRKKVEQSINADAEEETKSKAQLSDKLGKKQERKTKKETANKGNTNVKGKKGPKTKKEEEDTIEIDFLQLLPVWITMKIFKYLDEKTLKTIKNVNKYWEFIATSLNQDEKIRKKLDTFINSMKNEYNLHDVLPKFPSIVKPEFRFRRRDKAIIACDPKINTTLKYSKRFKMHRNNESILCKVANKQPISFKLPTSNLLPFIRKVPIDYPEDPTKYIHQRPKCFTFNNLITDAIPINDIPFMSASLKEFNFPDLTSPSSFYIKPSILTDLMQTPNKIQLAKKSSVYASRTMRDTIKKSEIDEMMSRILRKSLHDIEQYRENKTLKSLSTQPEFSNPAMDELEHNIFETQGKSMELKRIRTSIQQTMHSVLDGDEKRNKILALDDFETKILHPGRRIEHDKI